MSDKFDAGIFVGKASIGDLRSLDKAILGNFEGAKQSHRDDYHLFFLQETGNISIEIDFQKHKLKPSSVIYIHPSQVHRMITFENVTVSFWIINNENLSLEYLKLLEDITPAEPLALNKEVFSVISEAVALCVKLYEAKQKKLYYSLLKDGCNMLVGLVASQYLDQSKSIDKLSRFENITKAFKAILEQNFITAKRPSDYAERLNISVPYLNECVKGGTGYSVSYHIQQRIILEAKRLLYHTNKSVKEISFELGYEDYPYFSRLFTKITGMTPLSFRNKNLD